MADPLRRLFRRGTFKVLRPHHPYPNGRHNITGRCFKCGVGIEKSIPGRGFFGFPSSITIACPECGFRDEYRLVSF